MPPKLALFAAIAAIAAFIVGFLYISRPITYRLDLTYTLTNSADIPQPAYLAVAVPTKYGYQLVDLRTVQWPGTFRHSPHGSLEVYYFNATAPANGQLALRLEIVTTLRTGKVEWQAPILPAHERGRRYPVQETAGLSLPDASPVVWMEEYRDGAWRMARPPLLVRYLGFADRTVVESAKAQMRKVTHAVGVAAPTRFVVSSSLPLQESIEVALLN
ncbi:MAG: hypothetical protein IT168_30715 [Bryobacterales bacterium]|nr:hypothetical protein [Bryobacterales bacterium]